MRALATSCGAWAWTCRRCCKNQRGFKMKMKTRKKFTGKKKVQLHSNFTLFSLFGLQTLGRVYCKCA